MTNPFRTDLIDIFIRRGHKGKEIVKMVREIEALLTPTLADAEKWRKVEEIAKQHTYGECKTCKVFDHCHDFGTSLCWSARQVAETIEVKDVG